MPQKTALATDHLDTLLEIANAQFGDGYVTRDYLHEVIDPESPYFISVAFPENEAETDVSVIHTPPNPDAPNTTGYTPTEAPVGFCIGAIHNQRRIDNYLNIPRSQYPTPLREAERVGVPRTVAVRDDLQQHGVGTDLSEDCMTVLEDANVDVQCVVGWESPDGVRARNLLESLGFTQARMIPNYWSEESIHDDYNCDACGAPPCTCRAAIFLN